MAENANIGEPQPDEPLANDPRGIAESLHQQLLELRPTTLDEPHYPTLTAAARANDVAAIRTFLDRGANLHERTGGSRTPLSAACAAGAEDAVRLLIERGANLAADAFGRSPLRAAARGGHVTVVRLLVDAGISLDWPMGAGAVVNAIAAGQPDTAEALAQLDPEVRDGRAWLKELGMTELRDILEEDHFKPDKVRRHAERRRQSIPWLDKKSPKRAAPGPTKKPVLSGVERRQRIEEICARIASPDFVRILDSDIDTDRLLFTACRFGLVDVVRKLIDADCSLGARDHRQRNALHHAAAGRLGATTLDVALELVTAGIDVDSRDQEGRTPLMVAAAASDAELVELLLDAGADPTLAASGQTVAQHVSGPNEGVILNLLGRRTPDRPGVAFADLRGGLREWLDTLHGKGSLWAVRGELDRIAAIGAAALSARRIDDLESQPLPRDSGGWILLQLMGSPWTLLWPFGTEADSSARSDEELSNTLRRELLTVHVSDTAGCVVLRRWQGGRIVELAEWEIHGPCIDFRSEVRPRPAWLAAPHRNLERYCAELDFEAPPHRLERNGLDTQLVLPETLRQRIDGLSGLSKWTVADPSER